MEMLNKVQGMMKKLKDNAGPSCDAACQATNNREQYKEEYLKIKNDFLTGEKKVKLAEERYYNKTNQRQYYNTLKETRAKNYITKQMDTLTTSFNDDMKRLKTLVKLMGSQNIYASNVDEVKNTYKDKSSALLARVDSTTVKRKINNRLADFYNNRDESWAVWVGSYLWYIYVALIVIILIKMAITGGWKRPRKYLFVISMFLAHWIIKFIFLTVITTLGHFKLDISYLVFILSFMILAFIYLKIYDLST